MDIKVCIGSPRYTHTVYSTEKSHIWGVKISLNIRHNVLYDSGGAFVTERLNKQLNLK